MLSDAQVQQFRSEGFLRGAKVLTDEQVEAMQSEVLRVIADRERTDVPQPVLCGNLTGDPERAVWQIVNIWQASDAFRDLIAHPVIVEEVAQLAEAREVKIWHDQIQYKPAATGGVNMWHQDAPYWPILLPMTQVTAWVALDDVDEDNGCMRMVPQSHRWGNHIKFLEGRPSFDDMPTEFAGHPVTVHSCPVRRGEVHYHHALTWHGSGANVSGRPRRAIALHYATEQTRYVASGDHVMKPFVTSEDGAALAGEAFPVVWRA